MAPLKMNSYQGIPGETNFRYKLPKYVTKTSLTLTVNHLNNSYEQEPNGLEKVKFVSTELCQILPYLQKGICEHFAIIYGSTDCFVIESTDDRHVEPDESGDECSHGDNPSPALGTSCDTSSASEQSVCIWCGVAGEFERPLCENCVAIPNRINALENRLHNLECEQSLKRNEKPRNQQTVEMPTPDYPDTKGDLANDTPQTNPQTPKVDNPSNKEGSNHCDSHPSLSTEEQLREYREKQQARCASMNVQSPATHQRPDNTDVLIIGDSMIKSIKTRKLSKTRRIRCKTIPGAKIESASDTVLSHTCQFNPQETILHLGTNNVMHDETDEIIAKISSLADQIVENRPSTKITISTIIHRQSESPEVYQKVNTINNQLKLLANQRNWSIIANDNINPDSHIAVDGVHLNTFGTRAFATNIIAHLRNGTHAPDNFPALNTMSYQQPQHEQQGSRQLPRSYADAMKAQAPHFYSSRQRKKPKGRMFPRDWTDCLQTAHRLLNNRQS